MWCEHCRQNVTGMVSQAQDSVCCSRCGCALAGEMPVEAKATVSLESHPGCTPLPCPAPSRPASPNDWSIDDDLRHIERLLRRDQPQVSIPALLLSPLSPPASPETATPPPTTSWLTNLRTGIAWLLLCAGLASTVCGLLLLSWHYFANRAELLIPGLIGAAAGQFGLLGGFLIQPAARPVAPAPSPVEAAHPAAQWLEAHRRIDEILRAELPGQRSP